MSYRQHPTKGPGWWQIWCRPNGRAGKTKVYVIPGTEQDAARYDTELKRARRPAKHTGLFPVFADKLTEYLDYYSRSHLDSTNVTRNLFLWKKYVGDLQFAHITSDDLERFKRDRLDSGVLPVTINKEISALSEYLKWAKKKGFLDTIPDLERFPAKMTKAPLPDVPSREEVLALINVMFWPKCGYFACLYFAGLRAAEARELKAEDIYLDRRIMIVRGKGNKQRPAPIVDELVPWLVKRLAETPSGRLWTTSTGGKITSPKQCIKFALERAGISRKINPHLLRHAYGTHAVKSGVHLRAIQYSLGHVNIRTTQVYTTLDSNDIINEVIGKFGKG